MTKLMDKMHTLGNLFFEKVCGYDEEHFDFISVYNEDETECYVKVTPLDENDNILFLAYYTQKEDAQKSVNELLLQLLTAPVKVYGYISGKKHMVVVHTIWKTADGHFRVVFYRTWLDGETLDFSGDEMQGLEPC